MNIVPVEGYRTGIFAERHEEYHRRELGVASKSALDEIARTASKYRLWAESKEDESTPALRIGSAVHCVIHEPGEFAKRFLVEPDWKAKFGSLRTNVAKAEKAAWERDNVRPGITLLTPEQVLECHGMAAALRAHPLAGRILQDASAQHEMSVRWVDDGLPCKARVDLYSPSMMMVIDIKTSEDAGPLAWERTSINYGYHRQEAHYRNGLEALDVPLAAFLFLVVEKIPPFDIAIYKFDDESRAMGRGSILRDMAVMRECRASNIWPGFSGDIQTVHLPPWAAR